MNNEINLQNKLIIFINVDIFSLYIYILLKNDNKLYINKCVKKMVKQMNHIQKHADYFYNSI